MKKAFFFSFIFLSLMACKNESLEFETKKFSKKTITKSDTTAIEIEVAFAKNKTAVADSINKFFFNNVASLFVSDSTKKAKNYDEICTRFINDYEKVIKESPEYTIPWNGNASAKIDYQSPQLINLVVNYFLFTGGAHGYGASISHFINPENGQTIRKEELFSDFKGFLDLVEKKFRKQQKIPTTGSINQNDYWFANEKFHLPENVFYTEKGLLLLYNQYEVACYAEGPIEVLIPFSEADRYLKVK